MNTFKLLKFINQKCGTGKGRYMVKQITKGEYHIVVQSTKVLLEQFKQYLKDIDPLMMVSDDDFNDNLLQRINESLSNKNHKVLMITDKMFYRIELKLLEGWKVWIDDCNKFFDLHIRSISAEDNDEIIGIYRKLFITGSEYIEISAEQNDPVNKKYKSAQINDKANLSIDTKVLLKLYRNLKFYHNIAVLEDSLNGNVSQLVIAGWYDLTRYTDYGIDITYLSNDFTNSLIYKRWSHLFNEIKLDIDHEKINSNDARIDIKYFFESTKSDRGLSKTQLQSNDNNICKVQQWIMDNLDSDKYYWTTNNECQFKLPGQHVPVVTRGLNNYQNYDQCVFIAAMNAHPQSDEYLNDLFNFTRSDLLLEYEKETMYQFIYRSCIRDYEKDDRVTVYVYDSEAALSIPSGSVTYIDIGLSTEKKKRGVKPSIIAPEHLKNKFKTWKSTNNHKADTFIRFYKWIEKIKKKHPEWESMDFSVLSSTLSIES